MVVVRAAVKNSVQQSNCERPEIGSPRRSSLSARRSSFGRKIYRRSRHIKKKAKIDFRLVHARPKFKTSLTRSNEFGDPSEVFLRDISSVLDRFVYVISLTLATKEQPWYALDKERKSEEGNLGLHIRLLHLCDCQNLKMYTIHPGEGLIPFNIHSCEVNINKYYSVQRQAIRD